MFVLCALVRYYLQPNCRASLNKLRKSNYEQNLDEQFP